jgi:hypothetical protein
MQPIFAQTATPQQLSEVERFFHEKPFMRIRGGNNYGSARWPPAGSGCADLHLGREHDPRPDTLRQTDQRRATITLADGAGHTFHGQSRPAPEQKDHNDDQQQQAEPSSIIMIWRSIIKTPTAEQDNQYYQKNDKAHRFTPVETASYPVPDDNLSPGDTTSENHRSS